MILTSLRGVDIRAMFPCRPVPARLARPAEQAEQAGEAPQGGPESGAGGDDGVVDAEFEEVDDDKK